MSQTRTTVVSNNDAITITGTTEMNQEPNPTTKKKQVKVIIIKETLLVSWMKDLVTFGWLLGGQFLNYTYLGNSWIVTLTLCISIFAFAMAKGKDLELTPEDAIEQLKKMRKDHDPL